MCYKMVELVYSYDIPATHKSVLLALAYKKHPKNGRCYPSRETLAAMTGLNPRTITRSIKWLKDNKYITFKRMGTPGRQVTQYNIRQKKLSTKVIHRGDRESRGVDRECLLGVTESLPIRSDKKLISSGVNSKPKTVGAVLDELALMD